MCDITPAKNYRLFNIGKKSMATTLRSAAVSLCDLKSCTLKEDLEYSDKLCYYGTLYLHRLEIRNKRDKNGLLIVTKFERNCQVSEAYRNQHFFLKYKVSKMG